LIFAALFAHLPAHALTVEYNLTITQQKVNITGNPARGMTINGAIPGPTLHFKEGDSARIHVHNKMSMETSIHRQCD
jgi:FtsP/CotA-like multicopper oxidase with cupredoxin domain